MSRFALAICLLVCMSISAQAESLPNIILLMGDDHGWEETGYYNHPFVKTPVLDEMSRTALRLDNFYAGHPTCSPTRASVITGRHPNRAGTFEPNYSLRPGEPSVAHIMQNAGYTTAHFGKWHVGPVKKSSPTSPGAFGFERWLSHDNFFELNPILSPDGGKPQQYDGESSEILVEHAIQFIDESHKKNKPFFIIIWYGSPHEPYSGLTDDLALYDNLPEKYSEKQVGLTSNETGQQVKRPLRDVLQERYAEITALDRSLGTLRTHLKEHDLRDNTMLWYCGDNGTPPSGYTELSPLRDMKGSVYEGGIRVPGLIEWPAKITSPRISTISSVTSDILPTLCAITGQDLPGVPLDGINIMPLIEGTMEARSEPIHFWEFETNGYGINREQFLSAEDQRGTTPLVKYMKGIRTRNFVNYKHPEIKKSDYAGNRVILDGQFKLIISGAAKNGKVELYDLVADLGETNNLADSQPERVKQMSQQLRKWQKSVLTSLMTDSHQ